MRIPRAVKACASSPSERAAGALRAAVDVGHHVGGVRVGVVRCARGVRPGRRTAAGRKFGLPSLTPRALAAASAAIVRCEIISRSCSATAARMWIVSRVACGLSQATKSTPDSIKFEIKATLRASRSSLAMTKVAPPQPAGRERGGDLRPVVFLAELDLLKLGDDHAARPGNMAGNRLALRFQAQPRGALLGGRTR